MEDAMASPYGHSFGGRTLQRISDTVFIVLSVKEFLCV